MADTDVDVDVDALFQEVEAEEAQQVAAAQGPAPRVPSKSLSRSLSPDDRRKERRDEPKRRRDERDRDRRSSRDRDRDRGDRRRRDERDRDRDRDRYRDDDRRERRSDRDRDRDRRDRDRDRRDRRDREDRDRDRERDRRSRRSPERESRRRPEREPPAVQEPEPVVEKLTQEEIMARQIERDKRTVFVSSLHPKVDDFHLFEFFSTAGKVRDVRMVTDKRGKSQGFSYVEFYDPASVAGALNMAGSLILGHPVAVKLSECEKNAAYELAADTAGDELNALLQYKTRLYVGNLSPKLSEEDLTKIFSHIGELEYVRVDKDPQRENINFAYVKYKSEEHQQTALTSFNGEEVLEHKFQIGIVPEEEVLAIAAVAPPPAVTLPPQIGFDDKTIDTQARLALTAKMSNGSVVAPAPPLPLTAPPVAMMGVYGAAPPPPGFPVLPPQGLAMPPGMQSGVYSAPQNMYAPPVGVPPPTPLGMNAMNAAPDTSRSTCLLLTNLFDHKEEEDDDFDEDIKEEVAEQVKALGAVLTHIHVDKYSADGSVWMKFADRASAEKVDTNMNGRWFAKRKIKTVFIPPSVYAQRCPEAA